MRPRHSPIEFAPDRAPWEPQPDESTLWLDRFNRFRLAGPGRSMLATYNAEREKAGKSGKVKRVPAAWDDAADRWRWHERAERWDAHEAARLDAEREAERIRARDRIRDEFDTIVKLASARILDALQPGAEPNAVQTATARWAIDKLVASADAREQAKGATASADKYAEVLERITARPEEVENRMRAIGRVQNEVVERRRPHIISPPDSDSA